MKKKLSLILALLLLLTCLAACTENVAGTSEGTENDSSDAAASNDESTPPTVEIQYETVVSTGKTYKASVEADSKYDDSYKTELCDGVFAPGESSYTDERFAGYTLSGTLRVDFEMGGDNKQLYKFGASYFRTNTAGIGSLGTSRIFISQDGENWERLGYLRIDSSSFTENTGMAWMTLDVPVDANYVRFELRGTSTWLFLDELVIIANTEGSSINQNYLQQLEASYTGQRPTADDIKLGTTALDRTANEVMISQSRMYSVSRACSKNFPDSDKKDMLTDGVEPGSSYESGAYVGFNGGDELNIDVKLGKVYDGLANFELSMYQMANLHYMLPYYVDVYVTEDDSNFERVGRVYAPSDLSITAFTFSLRLANGVSAKTVRFSLPKTDTDLFLVEEAAVYYYGESLERPLYDPLELPEVTKAEYAKNPSKKEVNLALKRPYQLVSGTDLTYAAESSANTPASKGVLTDGVYSPNTTFNNGYWNQTRNGTSRRVYIDLGYNCSVTGFSINYLNLSNYAICVPNVTTLYLSEDGKTWYPAGMAKCVADTSVTNTVKAEYRLETPVEARFAYVSFACVPHTYADEIEILGTTAITSQTIRLADLKVNAVVENTYCAPDPSRLGGVHDLALIYYNIIKSDEDFYLPYVAYMDEEGNIKDTMFDGYLFLPSVRSLATGGLPYADEKNPSKLEDWMYQYNENFKEGRDFDALNKAVGTVKKALSLPDDYKVKVYATIMWPCSTLTDFGDIDGDGVTEDISTMEGLEKVIDVYMSLYLNTFAEKNYENLTFEGFYWFEEAVTHNSDVPRIQLTARVAESKGSQLFWIPYYTASGFTGWNADGFSVACMQPNYVFRDNVPVSRLYNAANYIRALGMGIEIEIDDTALTQLAYFKRYMRYLGYGIEAGYMKDCIHMYYQSGQAFYNAAHSDSFMARKVYETTYKFIKGLLTIPEKLADSAATCEKDGVLTGTLLPNDGDLRTAKVIVSPQHGTVTVNPDGTYRYVPYAGFTGTDSFEFSYSDYLAWSEPTTVTITVG